MDDELRYGDWYFYSKYGMSKAAALCKCSSLTLFGDERDALGVAKCKDADIYMTSRDRTSDGYVHLTCHHPWCLIHSPEEWEQEAQQTKEKWEAFYGKPLYSNPTRIQSRLRSLSEMRAEFPHSFPSV